MAQPVTGSFFRLHPHLRHAIVHDLGWRALRPVQELASDAILDGCNAIVLAPTAGGKTEASLFPVLSRILSEELQPVAALYVCPIRALLNNQEERVQRYARMVGLDAFKWHGDVSASAKARFVREPAHVLMITPESLEVTLISERAEAKRLFAGLSAVIIDEIHAFAADDRGAHLVSLLERLTRFCGQDLQRIGLSATVGNPEAIGRWLGGSSQRPCRVIDPPGGPAPRELRVDLLEDDLSAARAAAQLGAGKKSLVFVESRSRAERIAAAMGGRGLEVFVHHSAVSRADRRRAEEQFAGGTNIAIVCTSTMELGIDVGDLDLVLQVGAPSSVASALQRMGRTGRRPGTQANLSLLCQSPEELLQATALVRRLVGGHVEDVVPARAAAHVLAHQILALTLQEGGISRHQVLDWIGSAAPFQGLSAAEVRAVVETMLKREILHEADGLLSLGRRGEDLYGRRHFFELYAVFSSPPVLRVLHGATEVGTVEATFLRAQGEARGGREGGPLCFRLAGRAWQVREVSFSRGTCQVTPAATGRVPSWLGPPLHLAQGLCAEMKAVLREEAEIPWLSPAAARELAALREGYAGLVEEGEAPLELSGGGVQWHTFGGGAINRLLAAGLDAVGGGRWAPGNLSLRLRDAPGLAAAAAAVEALKEVDWAALAAGEAALGPQEGVSKFAPCLPPELLGKLAVERLFDVEGAARLVRTTRVPCIAGRG